ncbi:MAG: response regulator, partial [Synergistaceae bacterium]|nr:response regulator [Synergistaceae bacterium]
KIMKPKVLYISERPSMSADMLIKKLDDSFEIMRARGSDEVSIPKIILVNLAGLSSTEIIKKAEKSKIFLLGNQAEIDSAKNIFKEGAEFFVKPFNADEIRSKILEITQNNGGTMSTILLVDDDAVMIRTLREGLSTSYKVLPANGGANALKILERAKPDLILLDYEMPVMNGPQVLEAIRSNPATADIPVMFLTAKTDAAAIEKIEALKPQGHMLKTLPLAEIKEIIQKFLE